ncbi:MAG: ATP-binding protein [Chloroflexota bacterium]|nr:ATP-binding protein [Chloroflexota bacterium]
MNHPAFRDTLTDLRVSILRRLSWVMMIACATVAYGALFYAEFPADLFALALLGMVGMLALRGLIAARIDLARFGAIALLHVLLFAAMVVSGADWLNFFGAALVLVTGMISSTAHWGSALAICAFSWATGTPPERLMALVFTLGVTGAVMQVSVSTLYTAVSWYSAMQQRADDLLHETRQRQAELAGTVKSLEIAYHNMRRLSTQLVTAQRQADDARRMKERFAANISHELRTPLNLILGFSEIMTLTPEVYGDTRFPVKLTRDLYQIYASSRHLMAMIDDVLDLSQIDLSSFALNLDRTDPEAFMRETGAMCANLFRDGKLDFAIEVAPDLPEIEIDRTRIRQVLLNLLSNAHRFTERGRVTLAVAARGAGVAFSVSDSGRGIPADKLGAVFDEFFQVDYSLSRSHGGAGLGLAICKHFVERHGGYIAVESVEGVGSTFTFTLPARASSGSPPLAETIPDAGATVLVIDRDPLVGSLIRRALAPLEVIQIDDSAPLDEAIDLHQPIVLIANRPAPSLDARLIALTLPVIRCAMPSAAAMLDDLGVQGFLPKPFTTGQLADLLRVICGAHGARRILIVDDDIGFVQLVGRGLETIRPDAVLLRAYNGVQALTLIRESAPDLVLLDLIMPEMDGFALIAAVRGLPRMHDLPIVLLTATRYAHESETFGAVSVERAGGMRPAETLRALRGLVGAIRGEGASV